MKKQIETSHQAPTLKGYAAAWRQLIQLNFYGNLNYADDMLANTTVSNWYSRLSGSTIEQFFNVDKLIASGDYSSAQSLNNSINATLLPEQNQKSYNNILIQHYIRMLSIPNH